MQELSRRLVASRFAPAGASAVRTAVCLVKAESGFNPGAISPTGDYGLPQANLQAHGPTHSEWWRPLHGFRYALFDPVFAVGVMYAMSSGGHDWSAWTGTYGRGLCR